MTEVEGYDPASRPNHYGGPQNEEEEEDVY